MEKIIRDILNEIVETFRNDNNLLSLTPVGSFVNPDKKLEKFNDLDLVFIFKDLSAKEINNIKKIGKKLKNEFSDKNIEIVYTLKMGPIKFSSKKQKIILIHFIVLSQESYVNYIPPLVRFSFQHFPPIFGKSLKRINHIKNITKEDLFNDFIGIPAMRRWIKNKTVEYLEPKTDGIKMTHLKLDNKQYFEIIFYSILRLASNMVRLKGMYVDIDRKMCKEFEKEYPITLKDFPERIIELKGKMRNDEKTSSEEIKELKLKSLKFINQCEAFLKTQRE